MPQIKRACGNCGYWTPPRFGSAHGPCKSGEGFVGNLRTEALFFCKNFKPTTPRRLSGDEEREAC